tara:strand:+ start:1194 stop:2219 length:1026 start_codon:yes stop_codon:yes gene_type:complete
MKLSNLIFEAKEGKVIIMAGAAGAGKSHTVTSSLKGIIPDELLYNALNPDKYVEDKDGEFYNNLARASQQVDKVDLPNALASGETFVYDTTAMNSAKIIEIGENHNVLMLMVYTHPIIAFAQNFMRERNLPEAQAFATWVKVYKLAEVYRDAFKDNFILLHNKIQAESDHAKKFASIYNSTPEVLINTFNEAAQSGGKSLVEFLENLKKGAMERTGNDDYFVSSFTTDMPSPSNKGLYDELMGKASLKDLPIPIEKVILKDFNKNLDKYEAGVVVRGRAYDHTRLGDLAQKEENKREKKKQEHEDTMQEIAKMLLSAGFEQEVQETDFEEAKAKVKTFVNA